MSHFCLHYPQVTLFCSDGVQRVDVWSGLRNEEMSPQATLKHHAQVWFTVSSFTISSWTSCCFTLVSCVNSRLVCSYKILFLQFSPLFIFFFFYVLLMWFLKEIQGFNVARLEDFLFCSSSNIEFLLYHVLASWYQILSLWIDR